MNAAKTRRKGRKSEEAIKNVNEVLAAAQEQTSMEIQDSSEADNSTRTSESKRIRKDQSHKASTTSSQKISEQKSKDQAKTHEGQSPESKDSASQLKDFTDASTASDSNIANESQDSPKTEPIEPFKPTKANESSEPSESTDANKHTETATLTSLSKSKSTESSKDGKDLATTDSKTESKSEAQSEEDAKAAERLARIEKARAQAKAFAEARAKKLAQASNEQSVDDSKVSAKETVDSKDSQASSESKGESTNATDEIKSSGANLRAFLAGITLAFFATLCVICIITVEQTTKEQITTYRNEQEQQLLSTMLPQAIEQAQGKLTYQCKLLSDPRIGKNMQAYLVQDEQGNYLGLIANYSTSRGYSNPLILMAGVDMHGKVTRIEVKLTKETPGIGDKVEHRRGNYLDQFVGWGLDDATWEVKKFGGQFDYITGATVTSRAVVLATRDLLQVLRETTHPDLLPNCR